MPDPAFTFEISLSVLNHLGRHLYRSFATVLGEAISNAWDADARNVWIQVDSNQKGLWIKDDGTGMTAADFQDKFLKIGYSKRKTGSRSPKRHRPYIGRKGIGKLALLSCAERISVISKVRNGNYVGGTIDNPSLDKAITDDLTPKQYPLSAVRPTAFAPYTEGHTHGTIIRFDKLKLGVRRSLKFVAKIIALYFRFSLLDRSFNIYLNGERITHRHLRDLLEKTQFLWKIDTYDDPYLDAIDKAFATSTGHETREITLAGARGFIASVVTPRNLKIMTTDERVGVDLFVNGRLRERDILKHIPTARIVESYLYGQIHFDGLDDGTDRFTSSREGVVADDPKYQRLLERLRERLLKIAEDWDRWRIRHRAEGDPDNPRMTKTRRASLNLYGAVADQYVPPAGTKADEVDRWVSELSADAVFNFESYAECFVSENLVRRFILKKGIALSPEAKIEADKFRKREADSKQKGNISIAIRRDSGDLSFLDMQYLANLADKPADVNKEAALARDSNEFKPMRDAVAHTALLTTAAKARLTAVRENIKARVRTLLAKG